MSARSDDKNRRSNESWGDTRSDDKNRRSNESWGDTRSDDKNRRSNEIWGDTRSEVSDFAESPGEKTDQQRQREERMIFRNRMEYLAILFVLQFGNNNFVVTVAKCAEYNGISFLIVYYCIHLIVVAPLQCQHLFLGYYSKFGYMKVWNIFPIGYGIGASMMAFSLYTCIHRSTFTGQLVLQFLLIPFMPENYWTDCKYKSEHLPPCYELNSDRKDIDCNKTYYPGVAQYYRVSNLWRPDEKPDGIGPLNMRWITASAVVWIIVGILTICDFKSFKGIFAKTVYSVTSVFFVLLILQWASRDQSAQGALLMLDFTGLYNYKVWVGAFTHAILMSHICEGTIIQLGSYGPVNAMPDTDALFVGFLASIMQYLAISYVYSSYGWMATFHRLDINCFILPHETVVTALTPTQLSRLPMAALWFLVVFFIFSIKGIMEMTIVFTSTVNSFSEAFPSVKAYRSYLVSVVILTCFSMSLIFTTKVGEIFAEQSLNVVGTLATLLILAIMSLLILFSYSISRLCDDIQFIHKFEPTLLMKAVFYLTPLLASYFTVTHLADFWLTVRGEIDSHYSELWELQMFLILSGISLITPLLIVVLVMYGIHVRTHTVELLFHPTKYWGYPDEEVNEARRRFNPRRELRHKSNNPCTHRCLLDDKRMRMEVKKREAVRIVLKRYGFQAMPEV